MLITRQSAAGTWVRQVRCLSAKLKETFNFRCHLCIYTPVRTDTSISSACKTLHSPPSSPNPDAENSCSVSTNRLAPPTITTRHSLTSLTELSILQTHNGRKQSCANQPPG